MALIVCPGANCNRQISDKAEFCPHCRRPMSLGAGKAIDTPVPDTEPAELLPSSLDPVAPEYSAPSEAPDRWEFLLSRGILNLPDYFIPDLDQILAAFLPRIRAGQVSSLHLHGEDWSDQNVRQLRRALLPETGDQWFSSSSDQHAAYAQRLLPGLTTLQVTFGSRLSVGALQDFASLSSLTNVDLSLWQAHEGSADGIQQLLRLPKLRSVQLPLTLQNMLLPGDVTRRDALIKFLEQSQPNLTVL